MSPASAGDSAGSALGFALAAGALGRAVQLANGAYHPDAILWLTVCALFATAALFLPRYAALERWAAPALVPVLAGILALQFGQLLTTSPGIYLRLGGGRTLVPLFMLLAAAAVLVGASAARGWLGRVALPLLLLLHFAAGVWMLQASPSPFIDVFVFQRDSSAALLQGQNPYSMTYPDIYGSSAPFYGEGLSVGGRLQFGFPYPPLSLVLALAGHVLGGDYRWAQLAAMTGAGALMGFSRPGPVATLAAALFLFTPRGLFVLEQGWTEPFAVLLLALVVFVATRAPRFLPVGFGLFLAIKQYFVFAVPLGLLLLPRPWRPKEAVTLGAKAAAVTLAVSLPLVLWDVGAFVRSAVTLQLHQPFRKDALSFLAHWLHRTGEQPSTAIAFAVVVVLVALAVWRVARTPAGFAGAVAVAFLGFFAFNKQAFCNYYYFVIGALACAVAATHAPEADAPPATGADGA